MKRIMAVFMICVCCQWTNAQHQTELNPTFFALIVQDMDQSLSWYQQHLGYQVDDVKVLETRGLKIANLSNGASRLELIEFQEVVSSAQLAEQLPAGARVAGVFKIGFDISDFDNTITTLKEAEVQFRGDVVEDPVSGKRMIIILDSDGNRIQLFEK
jgi:catechol 2,3-dioxygenase-like lactoylglutathione lyase family enzyme